MVPPEGNEYLSMLQSRYRLLVEPLDTGFRVRFRFYEEPGIRVPSKEVSVFVARDGEIRKAP